ncbi:UNKNOWN [Stylonychia lemnae]|uniref:Uncharacterized protein n=1 Tax=Stylonychia lemnae TaxID=5949 RepID=A0A077ZV63_STYLE|nr:UNKNOWN [Stylonychia lemnae]|eukprot:CDW73190.1 UNKNOWN [Stylonychia lemnae]
MSIYSFECLQQGSSSELMLAIQHPDDVLQPSGVVTTFSYIKVMQLPLPRQLGRWQQNGAHSDCNPHPVIQVCTLLSEICKDPAQ